VAANLRLVVSVAKKYTKRNMSCSPDPGGQIGLGAPASGESSTHRGYSSPPTRYWWIRQGIHPGDWPKSARSGCDPHHRNAQQLKKVSVSEAGTGAYPEPERAWRWRWSLPKRSEAPSLLLRATGEPGNQGGDGEDTELLDCCRAMHLPEENVDNEMPAR